MSISLTDAIRAINAGGVVSVLVLGLWLGLRGDVVTAEQLRDCRMARDAYLADLLKETVRPLGPDAVPKSIAKAAESAP